MRILGYHLLLSDGLRVCLVPLAGFPLPWLLAPVPCMAAPSSLNCPAPSPVKEGACIMGDPRRGSTLASQPTLFAATQFSPAGQLLHSGFMFRVYLGFVLFHEGLYCCMG